MAIRMECLPDMNLNSFIHFEDDTIPCCEFLHRHPTSTLLPKFIQYKDNDPGLLLNPVPSVPRHLPRSIVRNEV